MNVMIVGGGRTGTQLAYLLLEQNHQVRVIDHRKEVLVRLHRELPTEVIYEGNATEVDLMERAGVREADVVAACTTSDEDNLVICYLARRHFGVRGPSLASTIPAMPGCSTRNFASMLP